MAEISYPFAAASEGGGTELVSQLDWQRMAHLWGPDRIDFQLAGAGRTGSDLPFYTTVSGTSVVVNPGSAWVGGFYYILDEPLSLSVAANTGSTPRRDLVVIRADMAAGSVNLAILQGQPATVPREPSPRQILGGVWEMPIYMIEVGPNNGGLNLGDRRRFAGPGTTYVPWNRSDISSLMPIGNFTIDLDNNNSGGIEEGFRGLEGDMYTRTLGKRRSWTPDVFNVSNKPPAANRTGLWRRIAPGTISFSLEIRNTSTTAATTSAVVGVSLPQNSSQTMRTVFTGFLDNPDSRDGLPNFMHIVARTNLAAPNMYLYYQNPRGTAGDLDALRVIPGKSTLYISGSYETDEFEGRSGTGA